MDSLFVKFVVLSFADCNLFTKWLIDFVPRHIHRPLPANLFHRFPQDIPNLLLFARTNLYYIHRFFVTNVLFRRAWSRNSTPHVLLKASQQDFCLINPFFFFNFAFNYLITFKAHHLKKTFKPYWE